MNYFGNGVEMAVWGGRCKFDDLSITKQDYTSPYCNRTSEVARIQSTPVSAYNYWRTSRNLRPKDHFASAMPLKPAPAKKPCPLGCPCNQSQELNHTRDNLIQSGRHHSNTSHMSSHVQPPSSYAQSPNMFIQYPFYQGDLRSTVPCRPTHRHPNWQTSPIFPKPAIPVGWGSIDHTTVYQEVFTGEPYFNAQSTIKKPTPKRSESPPRWETSYCSAFCRSLTHVTRGY